MEYNFKLPELPTNKEGINNWIEAAESAVRYWERVKTGNGLWFEVKGYTEQYKDSDFVDANIKYFKDILGILNKRLKSFN